MFLSKLVLNERNRQVQYDLGNAHQLHQKMMHAFPDEADQHPEHWSPRQEWNILFRQEPSSTIILVQSDIEPNWSVLPQDYIRNNIPEIKPLSLHPMNFGHNQLFRFRLKANPSKRDKESRKTIGFYNPQDQYEWLQRQSERNGFSLVSANIIPTPNIFAIKRGNQKPICIKTVIFDGLLKVDDFELFSSCIRQGIGRGKSYGCGLLSIAKSS